MKNIRNLIFAGVKKWQNTRIHIISFFLLYYK